jgi:hypothetical protein
MKMALRADFEVITFWEHLGDKEGDIKTSAKFVGNQTTVRNFFIGQAPYGRGYVTLQLYDVHSSDHHIKINGVELAGMDIPKHPKENRWLTWSDTIETGILKQGSNTIQIVRASGGDNFIVRDVIIHWRELA